MRPSIGRAILGGFVATPAMTVLMYTVAPLIGVRVDIAEMLGSVLGGWTWGLIMHIINGSILFPLVYGFVASRFLPGPPTSKGVRFGIVLWLMSQLFVMPIMGAGFFSIHLGVMAVIASLLGHLVYGALLGFLAGETVPLDLPRAVRGTLPPL